MWVLSFAIRIQASEHKKIYSCNVSQYFAEKFFYAGDMRITEKQKEEIDRQRQTGQKREATRRQNAKWPNGTVYYEIDRRLGMNISNVALRNCLVHLIDVVIHLY